MDVFGLIVSILYSLFLKKMAILKLLMSNNNLNREEYISFFVLVWVKQCQQNQNRGSKGLFILAYRLYNLDVDVWQPILLKLWLFFLDM
jgi:hypothetical protein